LPDLAGEVWAAAEALREGTEALVAMPLNDRFAGAVPYLRAFARVLGAGAHLKAALAEGDREALARVMIRRILPEHAALLAEAREGAAGLYAVGTDDLAA
ncbi:MAG: acyl-CoA dehydrogenase, partial [Tabrizicola sp.]